MSPELFSSLLISSQLISAFSGFRSSSQRFSALSSSCQLILCLLISSLNLLTPPQLTSALVSSSHLISALLNALSYHLTSSLAQTCSKNEKLVHTASFCTEKLDTQKLLHRDREAFTHSKFLHRASFYTGQAFTQSKLLHRNLYIEKLLNAASFEALFKRKLKRKITPKLRKSVDKSLSQP